MLELSAKRKQEMENKYTCTERIKDFLASDSPRAKITLVTLCVLAAASLPVLVFAAAAMGNAVQIFKYFHASKNFSERRVRNSINQLRRQDLIEYVGNKQGGTVIRITKRGKSRLREFDVELMSIKKPTKWDGKWRMVVYDLPVRFKRAREELRWKLKDLGFFQFQKSVWVHPYPCEDEIIFISDFYGVGKYVDVLTVENILRDEKIKKHFGLESR